MKHKARPVKIGNSYFFRIPKEIFDVFIMKGCEFEVHHEIGGIYYKKIFNQDEQYKPKILKELLDGFMKDLNVKVNEFNPCKSTENLL